MNMMQNAAAGTIRASLRYPAFRRLLSALAVSQIGDWIHNLALAPPVCNWTHWAGAATVARVVPIVVLGPLGGAIADRFDQRLIMTVPDTSRLTPCCWHSPRQRTCHFCSRRRPPQRRPWRPRPAWDVSPPPRRGWSMTRTCQARTRPVGGHLHRCRGWARARGRRAPVRVPCWPPVQHGHLRAVRTRGRVDASGPGLPGPPVAAQPHRRSGTDQDRARPAARSSGTMPAQVETGVIGRRMQNWTIGSGRTTLGDRCAELVLGAICTKRTAPRPCN